MCVCWHKLFFLINFVSNIIYFGKSWTLSGFFLGGKSFTIGFTYGYYYSTALQLGNCLNETVRKTSNEWVWSIFLFIENNSMSIELLRSSSTIIAMVKWWTIVPTLPSIKSCVLNLKILRKGWTKKSGIIENNYTRIELLRSSSTIIAIGETYG